MADENNAADETVHAESNTLRVNPERYWYVVGGVLLVGFLLFAATLLTWLLPAQNLFDARTVPRYIFTGLLLVWLAYFSTSWRIIQETEVAGLWVLQVRAKAFSAGIIFAPRFLTEVHALSIQSRQDELPGEPEVVAKTPDEVRLEKGMKRPIRITTRGLDPNEAGAHTDPLMLRLTLEISIAVRWRLDDKGIFKMWTRIPGDTQLAKELFILKTLHDIGDTQATETLAKKTTAELLMGFEEVNAKLQREMQIEVADMGVIIERAHIKSPDIPHDVNIALARMSAATANARAVGIKADGDLDAAKKAAEGVRYARIAEGEGEKEYLRLQGEGQFAAAEALGLTGEQWYIGKVTENSIGQGDIIASDGGVAGILGMVRTAIGSGNSDSKKSTPPKNDSTTKPTPAPEEEM